MGKSEPSRRDFLRTSAAGLALGLGAGGQADESAAKKLRWGIIGTGARSRHHIKTIKSRVEMEIVAACDVDEGRLQMALARIDKPVLACRDYEKLLEMSEINAILICTPNMFHKEMVIAALEAGKHVMCEKPMASTWEECQAMRQAEERSSNVVLYTLQLRYSYRFQEFRNVVLP